MGGSIQGRADGDLFDQGLLVGCGGQAVDAGATGLNVIEGCSSHSKGPELVIHLQGQRIQFRSSFQGQPLKDKFGCSSPKSA